MKLAVPLLSIISSMIGQASEPPRPEPVVVFHVATTGSDQNPGTATAPFATLQMARNSVRRLAAAGLAGDVRISIHGGRYAQAETLTFGPEDSGDENHAITYAAVPGDEVVLTGGRRITGWKKSDGEIWTTKIPEVAAGRWNFRQLFVNGRRAVRARTPNADAKDPWWQITMSSAKKEDPPSANDPITVRISGPIHAYAHPDDVELVYMQNNESARKRLGRIDEAAGTFTLAPPHRWNPKVFSYDWYLSLPLAGKACYLENAREMLDEPGEWYLDRETGVLSYWPRAGEDLTRDEVVAPVVQNTFLAVAGSRERPVLNLHFQGLRVEYVDWQLPPWGYMAMFCCNIATLDGPKPGHRPIEAAVEFSHARMCSFCDGGVIHAGAMGICMREGTAQIAIEGNEVADLGGGGIAAGWPNSAAGYLEAAPPPLPGEFCGYRITNNYVHDCGTDYFGAVGILLFPTRQTRVMHNLIHHISYIGIGSAGSQDPNVTFDGDNIIERNEIHHAMTTTVDGAGIYITFTHHGAGTLVRGNLIHDTAVGKMDVPSAGLYLDGNCAGCRFEDNFLYRNSAAGPLILDFANSQKDNLWVNNLFQWRGSPPAAVVEALEADAGLEAAYRARFSQTVSVASTQSTLELTSGSTGVSVIQYDFLGDHGVLQVMLPDGIRNDPIQFKMVGLDKNATYEMQAFRASLTRHSVWGGPGVKQEMPMVGESDPEEAGSLGIPGNALGSNLLGLGLTLKPGMSPKVVWIAYHKK